MAWLVALFVGNSFQNTWLELIEGPKDASYKKLPVYFLLGIKPTLPKFCMKLSHEFNVQICVKSFAGHKQKCGNSTKSPVEK